MVERGRSTSSFNFCNGTTIIAYHHHGHVHNLCQRHHEEKPFVFLLTVLKQVFLGFKESPLHFFTVPLFSPLEHQVGWPGLAVQVMQVMLVFVASPSSMKGTRSRRRTTVTGARKLVLVRPAEPITMTGCEADCFTCKSLPCSILCSSR